MKIVILTKTLKTETNAVVNKIYTSLENKDNFLVTDDPNREGDLFVGINFYEFDKLDFFLEVEITNDQQPIGKVDGNFQNKLEMDFLSSANNVSSLERGDSCLDRSEGESCFDRSESCLDLKNPNSEIKNPDLEINYSNLEIINTDNVKNHILEKCDSKAKIKFNDWDGIKPHKRKHPFISKEGILKTDPKTSENKEKFTRELFNADDSCALCNKDPPENEINTGNADGLYGQLMEKLIVDRCMKNNELRLTNILNEKVSARTPELIRCHQTNFERTLSELLIKLLGYSQMHLCNIQYKGPDGIKKRENFRCYVRNNFYTFRDCKLVLDKGRSVPVGNGLDTFLDLFRHPYTQIYLDSTPLKNLLDRYHLFFTEVNESAANDSEGLMKTFIENDFKSKISLIDNDHNTYGELNTFKNTFKMNLSPSNTDYKICKFFNIYLIFILRPAYDMPEVFDVDLKRKLIDKIHNELLIPFLYDHFEMPINSWFNSTVEKVKDMDLIETLLRLLPMYGDHRKNYLKKLEKKYKRVFKGEYLDIYDTGVERVDL